MTVLSHASEALPLPRVLVVDDDTGVRDVCVRALRLQGYQVGAAENGRVALEKLRESFYDLVLTDLQMPEMGGIRLLQELRQLYADTDVIVFTAYGTFESAREALRLGAADYLTKPLELEDLERTVRRVIEWRRVRLEKQRLSEIVSVYEISQKFTTTLDTTTAVREIVSLLWRRFSPRTLSISLFHPDQGQLELLAQRGEQQRMPLLNHVTVDSPTTDATLGAAHSHLAGPIRASVPGYAETTVLRTNSGPIGVMRLERGLDQPVFGHDDRTMLAVCASQIAAALDNSRLYTQLKQQSLQTVAALAAAIEARDPYTRGHSEQVMRYAVRLAELVGFEEERVERLRYGALLHDIGKIGIRDHILLKPHTLLANEAATMNQHPKIGAEILRGVSSLADVIPLIERHHERVDGQGYPAQLHAADLNEEVRILSIADAYDAMTSDRAYRRAMCQQEALNVLLRARGANWDARLVDAFVAMIETEAELLQIGEGRPQQLAVFADQTE